MHLKLESLFLLFFGALFLDQVAVVIVGVGDVVSFDQPVILVVLIGGGEAVFHLGEAVADLVVAVADDSGTHPSPSREGILRFGDAFAEQTQGEIKKVDKLPTLKLQAMLVVANRGSLGENLSTHSSMRLRN